MEMAKVKAVRDTDQDCRNYVMQEARTMEEREMRLLDHKLPLHSPLPSLSSWSINNINLTGHFSGNSINFAIDILQNF